MTDSRPLATSAQEERARSLFQLELDAQEYAARHAHKFVLFNFNKYRYATPGMTEWVDRLAEFFVAPDLQGRLRAARERFLSPAEIERVEAFERDPL